MAAAELSFGQRLRQLRDAAGMTQQALAASAGINRVTVAKIETGLKNPSLAMMRELARAMDISVQAFFDPEK